MALKDSFINLNKALRTTLQNVPAVVDTLIRGFDEIGDAADAQTTYSTDEHEVGTWINGEKLYRQVISLGELPNNATKSIDNPISYGEIVGIVGFAKSSNKTTIPLPYPTTAPNILISVDNIRITTTTDLTSFIGTLILTYTKASASRSPEENDTKNVIDDEPVVKTVEDPVEAPAEELKK